MFCKTTVNKILFVVLGGLGEPSWAYRGGLIINYGGPMVLTKFRNYFPITF